MSDIALKESVICRLRQTHAYDVATRLCGSMWFLFLAAFIVRSMHRDAHAIPWPQMISKTCLVLFLLLLWLLIITRPPAKHRASGFLPCAAAFVGTYMPWLITLTVPTIQPVPNLIATFCITLGTCLTILAVLYLGRSFSIVPQARTLAQSGPYRWVRHPLYLAEEISVLGVVIQFLSPLTMVILITHVGVQIWRIHYEEELLLRTMPGYRPYAASTWRLIPFVW